MVNTRKVSGRRILRFETLDDLLAEVERLVNCGEVKAIGNWSAGQNMAHLAGVMERSIDGFEAGFPWYLRMFGKVFKGRILRGPVPAGFQIPGRAAVLVPKETSLEEGVAMMRRAIGRLKAETRRVKSPFMGTMSVRDWERFHCRHAELHLSFVVGMEAVGAEPGK